MHVPNTEERKATHQHVDEHVESIDGEVLETKYACEFH